MIPFTLTPSPTSDVAISHYDPNKHPKFRPIFETTEPNSPLSHLACDPGEADYAIVLENQSHKAITALRYRWIETNSDGRVTPKVMSSDSYMVDVFRPVAAPRDPKLISPSTTLDESLIDHVLRGGGTIGCRITNSISGRANTVTVALMFAIDLVLFDDGEIAGPDPDRFVAELQCRKPAAEFIAKQIRLAEAEHRDVTPVLSALAELPRRRDDQFGHWINDYARRYLSALKRPNPDFDRKAATLRHLENRPTLPKFYRRDANSA